LWWRLRAADQYHHQRDHRNFKQQLRFHKVLLSFVSNFACEFPFDIVA
jgi:hypothetical protein